MDRVGTVDLEPHPFAKHQKPRRVIDLAVGQDNADKRGIADRACGRCVRERVQLNQDVRRCIDEDPVGAIRTHGNRRLRPRTRPDASAAQTITVATIAIPLWESASGGGSENTYSHDGGKSPRPGSPGADATNEARRTS